MGFLDFLRRLNPQKDNQYPYMSDQMNPDGSGGILGLPPQHPPIDYNSPPYGDIGGPLPPQPDVPVPHAPQDDFYNQYMSRYQPEHSASDRFNQLLSQYPQHQPASLMRKITASLAGMTGGPKGADEVLDEPFNKDYADWKNQIGPVEQAANLERYMNVNERQLISQEATREETKHRNDIYAQDIDSKIKHRDALDEAKRFAETHPDYTAIREEGGTIKFVSKKDPTQVIDTGIPSGTMTELELQNLKGQQAQERVDTQVQGADTRSAQAGGQVFQQTDKEGNTTYWSLNPRTNRMEQIRAGNDESEAPPPPTNLVKPPSGKSSGTTGKGTSEYQESKRRLNVAQQIINTDPEARDWIQVKGNDIEIDPEGNFGDADPETQDKVRRWRDQIFNTKTVHMVGPDGKGYNVPAEKVELFKKNGYKVQ